MAQMNPTLLRGIHIFEPLDDIAIEQMLSAPENEVVSYKYGDYILKEEEEGDSMYVILEGRVEVLLKGGASGRQVISSSMEVPISTLHEGDFFGEQALLTGGEGKRNASVRAVSECKLFRIHKKYVELNVKRDLDLSISDITMIELPEDKEVREILESLRLFHSLNKSEIAQFREWTDIVEIIPQEIVVKEREMGESMYIVLSGELDVLVKDTQGKDTCISTLKKGNYFGEMALIPPSAGGGGRRSASVRGKTAARLIKIPKKYFRLSLKRDSSLQKAMKIVKKAQKSKIVASKSK